MFACEQQSYFLINFQNISAIAFDLLGTLWWVHHRLKTCFLTFVHQIYTEQDFHKTKLLIGPQYSILFTKTLSKFPTFSFLEGILLTIKIFMRTLLPMFFVLRTLCKLAFMLSCTNSKIARIVKIFWYSTYYKCIVTSLQFKLRTVFKMERVNHNALVKLTFSTVS